MAAEGLGAATVYIMKRFSYAVFRTLLFLLPSSLCFTSCEEFNLEEMFGNIIKQDGGEKESVTIEYTVIEEPVDDIIGGVVATNGVYCLLQRNDSLDGYMCYMGDETSEELPLAVYLDTFMTVRSIYCDETTYNILYDESSFEIIVYNKDKTWRIKNLSYDIFSSPHFSPSRVRGHNMSNGVDGWEAMANSISAVASISEIGSKPGSLSSKLGVVTLIGSMSDNKYVRRSSIALEMIMSLKNGGYLAASWGLYQLSNEACNEVWFGDVAITTLGAEHITDTKYRVWCSITNYAGISYPETMGTRLHMVLMKRPMILGNILAGDAQIVEFSSIEKDGAYYFEFDNLELGEQYCFQPRLYRTWMENVGGAANMTFADIFIAGAPISGVTTVERVSEYYIYGEVGTFATNSSLIESIEINDAVATSEMIDFSMDIKGKGYAALNNDDETLGQGSLGIYIKKGDEDYSYYPATSISGDDFTSEFKLQYSKSDMDDIDLSSFRAVKNIVIGSYVMAYRQTDLYDYEKVYYYSEPQDYELVYDKAPVVRTGESTDVSQTEATVKCDYKNCKFWNVQRGIEYFTDVSSNVKSLDATKEDGEYDFHLDGLSSNTTYKYRAYYEVNGVREYGETKFFKTEGIDPCPDHNHPHMIDLGLPSGIKWSCCDVGASIPEEHGGSYAWGETEEYDGTYKYFIDKDKDGECDSDEYINIGSNICGSSYDVARVKWGGNWRMPTLSEVQELCSKCYWQLTEFRGVVGLKITGPNGNIIFLPAYSELESIPDAVQVKKGINMSAIAISKLQQQSNRRVWQVTEDSEKNKYIAAGSNSNFYVDTDVSLRVSLADYWTGTMASNAEAYSLLSMGVEVWGFDCGGAMKDAMKELADFMEATVCFSRGRNPVWCWGWCSDFRNVELPVRPVTK